MHFIQGNIVLVYRSQNFLGPVGVGYFHSKAQACMTAFVAHGHELGGINYWAPIIDISKFTDIRFHARIGCNTKKFLLVRQSSSKIKLIFVRQFYSLYEEKYLNPRPLLSIRFPQGIGKYKKKF
jgi:hypothetical protein